MTSVAGARLPWAASLLTLAARVLAQWPIWLAAALPLLAFALQGDIGLNLWDEGFLWYGAQRMLLGEMPLRDFQAYDVGRYYWSAAWLWASGSDGILGLRFGNAVLAAVTGALAAQLLRRGAASWSVQRSAVPTKGAVRAIGAIGAMVVALGIVTVSLFVLLRAEGTSDAFATVLLVAALARVLDRPFAWGRWFACGAALGLIAAIGINHALYGTLALGLAALHLVWHGSRGAALRAIAPLACGAVLGYAPVLVPMLVAPGFAAAFVDAIRLLFEWGETNNALPLIPGLPMLAALVVALAVIAAACAAALVFTPRVLVLGGAAPGVAGGPARNPVFAAAVFVAVPYAHYAVSRMDLEHVAVSGLPIVIAAVAHPWRLPALLRLAVMTGIVWLSADVVLLRQPGRWLLEGWPLEQATVRGQSLRLKPWEAGEVALLRRLDAAYSGSDAGGRRSFYVAPYWPGAYAVFGRRSPTWETYAIFPATDERQRREIDRLAAAGIGFAVVSPARTDDREDRGFSATHPLVEDWIVRCMRRVPGLFDSESTRELRVWVADPLAAGSSSGRPGSADRDAGSGAAGRPGPRPAAPAPAPEICRIGASMPP